MIHKKLEKLGLSNNEAKAYLAALELGEASVQTIAEKAGLNRVTTHVTLERLVEEGLIKETKKGKRRQIVAEMPSKLVDNIIDKKHNLERQADELTKLLPELESIYNYSEVKPKVKFYEGAEGIQHIYEDTLVGDHKHIFAFVSYQAADKHLAKWLNEYYLKERVKRKIFAEVISSGSLESKQKKANDSKELRTTVLLPAKEFPLSIEVNIYGHKVAIMSFKKKEMMGLIIESSEVANTFKLIFKLAWQSAKNYAI